MSDEQKDVDKSPETMNVRQMPRLIISRNIYPVTQWHWTVEDQNGKCPYTSAGSFDSLDDALSSAIREGILTLEKVERNWAKHDAKFARLSGIKPS